MVCLLTTTGQLHIFNTSNFEDVLQHVDAFREVNDTISLANDGPMLLPNQKTTFPGYVHQIGTMESGDYTVLADSVNSVWTNQDGGRKVYVLTDSVKDFSANIMKLVIKRVERIDEPVKLISAAGFAVGALTNTLFAWGVDYVQPSAGPERVRLDGVVEENKSTVAQLVQDPIMRVTPAVPIRFNNNDQDSGQVFVDMKSTPY